MTKINKELFAIYTKLVIAAADKLKTDEIKKISESYYFHEASKTKNKHKLFLEELIYEMSRFPKSKYERPKTVIVDYGDGHGEDYDTIESHEWYQYGDLMIETIKDYLIKND